MIDGNHRLAAICLLEKEPDSCAPAAIDVDVHAGISKDTEKHIALSEPVVVMSCVSLCFICLLCVHLISLQEYDYIVPVHFPSATTLPRVAVPGETNLSTQVTTDTAVA